MVLSRGRVRLYGTLVLITLMPPATQYSELLALVLTFGPLSAVPPNWHDGVPAVPGVSNRRLDGGLTRGSYVILSVIQYRGTIDTDCVSHAVV